ncbi:hypothetical protein ABIE76_001578 [Sinorhizobium fredii]
MDEERRQHRHQEGVERHHVLNRDGEDRDTGDEAERSTEAGSRRNAKRERARQRIGEDRLHLGAGDRQRGTDGHRHQRDRHADIPDHHAKLIADGPGAEQRRQDVGKRVVRRSERHVDRYREKQSRKQAGKHQQPARNKGAVAAAPFDTGDFIGDGDHHSPPSESETK